MISINAQKAVKSVTAAPKSHHHNKPAALPHTHVQVEDSRTLTAGREHRFLSLSWCFDEMLLLLHPFCKPTRQDERCRQPLPCT